MKRFCASKICLLLFLFLVFHPFFPAAEGSWLDPTEVIKGFYSDFLNREPKKDELDKHIANLEERKCTLLDILNGIATSKEFADLLKEVDDIEFSYFEILGRPVDPEGHEHYLKKIREEKWTIDDVRTELRNSDEGLEFAIRQVYMTFLYRDADAPGLSNYLGDLKKKFKPFSKPTGEWKRGAFPKFQNWDDGYLKDVRESVEKSLERKRFNRNWLEVRKTLDWMYQLLLARKPDAEGFKHYLRLWSLCERHLVGIHDEMRKSDEFKKRKVEDYVEAYLTYLLRAPTSKELDEAKNRIGKASGSTRKNQLENLIRDLKLSDEGRLVAVRRLYWEILNREPTPEELKEHGERLKRIRVNEPSGFFSQPKMGFLDIQNAYRDIAEDLLRSSEKKGLDSLCAEWKEIRDEQETLWKDLAKGRLDFLSDVDKKFDEEVKEAEKLFDDLKKLAPAEFASMTYILETALQGKDLQDLKDFLTELLKKVEGLELLTADVQKLFIEFLGRPAPDFYSALNAQPAWDSTDSPVSPPNVPPGKLPPGVKPPTTIPTPTPTPTPTPKPPTQGKPSVPGFSIEPVPADAKLLEPLGKLLCEAKNPGDFKEKLISLIVASQEFKDREPLRKEAVKSLFQELLHRSPEEKELDELVAKLNTGKFLLDDLRAELEKNDEFKKLQELLLTGKIIPFLPEEKTKNVQESKSADESIKDKTLKLIDLEGFKDFDFASEVTVTDVEKTEDENGLCITGKTKVPSMNFVDDVYFFAKRHPSVYGHCVYLVGFFIPEKWEAKGLYGSVSPAMDKFLSMLRFGNGVLIHTSADVVLQLDSLPERLKKEFVPVLENSGYKSFRLSKGRNLVGNLLLDTGGACTHLKKLLPDDEKKLLIQGRLSKKTDELFLRGLLPPFRPSFFPKDCKQVEPSIEFTGKPSVGVKMSMDVTLPENQPMTAKVSFEIPISEKGAIEIAMSLAGEWKEPFKIKGLIVGNLVLTGKITIPEMAPTFGLAGDFQFGTKIVRVAAAIPVTIHMSSIGLLGAINEIGTQDLLMLFQKMGGKAESLPFPSDLLGFKDVEVSFSAKGDPTLKIQEGVCVKGELYIKSGEIANIDAVVSKSRGVIIKGSAKKIKLGPLELTGDGPDRKSGTADDCAIVDIEFPYSKSAHAFISGKLKIFGISRELKVLIDRRGMGFSFTDKIFDSWKSSVQVQGGVDGKKPDFNVKVEIESNLAKDLEDAVDKITRGHTPGFVKKIFRNLFTLRRAGFEGDLAKTIDGKIPKFWFEFSALGKRFDLTLSLDLSGPKQAVENMAKEAAKKVLSRVGDFVKEYLKAILEFFKKLFGGKKGKIDSIINNYKRAAGGSKPAPNYRALANKFGEYYSK